MKMGPVEKQFVNSPRHSRRIAAQAIERVGIAKPQPGQRLLDVGCGNGDAAVQLATRFGLRVTGADIDPAQISIAVDASPDAADVRFVVADATHLPFAEAEFDLVHTNKTTHHVRDWEAALGEMTRVLKPGGHLVYSDFVAPLGERFPTRNALNHFAAENGLYAVWRLRSPLHYGAVFRKNGEGPAAEPAISAMLSFDS